MQVTHGLSKNSTMGVTLVTTNESMNGWLVSIFTSKMENDLALSLQKWLELLKIESEARAVTSNQVAGELTLGRKMPACHLPLSECNTKGV